MNLSLRKRKMILKDILIILIEAVRRRKKLILEQYLERNLIMQLICSVQHISYSPKFKPFDETEELADVQKGRKRKKNICISRKM